MNDEANKTFENMERANQIRKGDLSIEEALSKIRSAVSGFNEWKEGENNDKEPDKSMETV